MFYSDPLPSASKSLIGLTCKSGTRMPSRLGFWPPPPSLPVNQRRSPDVSANVLDPQLLRAESRGVGHSLENPSLRVHWTSKRPTPLPKQSLCGVRAFASTTVYKSQPQNEPSHGRVLTRSNKVRLAKPPVVAFNHRCGARSFGVPAKYGY